MKSDRWSDVESSIVRTGLQTRPMWVIAGSDGSGEPSAQKCQDEQILNYDDARKGQSKPPDSVNQHEGRKMIIEAENVTKIYRTDEVETTALDRISLQLEEGQFVSIMGPSGCGKSTLLHVLGLIDNLSDGTYRFLGEDVSQYSERKRSVIRKKNIGFVFQSFNLIDELTVYENIELPLIYDKTPAAERKERVEAALEKMDITARRNHFPRQLSGGQQQRAAVARAIINQAKLILADEPTGNLDSEHGERCDETAGQAERGRNDYPDGNALNGKCRLQQQGDSAA